MTPNRRTTWIVGTLTVAVLVGVVVVGWRPLMERWYAARFADEELPHETRVHAARRLRDFGSPLLMETAVEVLSKYPASPRSEETAGTFRVLREAHKDFSESYAAASVRALRLVLRDGHRREKFYATSLLMLVHRFSLPATPELLVGMQSDDRELQRVSANVLHVGLVDWLREEGVEESPVTSTEFATRFGASHDAFCDAMVAIADSSEFGVRTSCLSILGKHLVPNAELEMKLPFVVWHRIQEMRKVSPEERKLIDRDYQLQRARVILELELELEADGGKS